MPSVLHFDMQAKDPEKLARFYEKVFGWKIEKWDGEFEYWMLTTHKEGEPGIDGGIGKRQGPT